MKKNEWDKLTKNLKFRNDEESESLKNSIEGKWQKRKKQWWRENKNGKEVKGGRADFFKWYIENIGTEMPGRCHYCGLEGDIKKYYDKKYYEKGNRKNCGERLEIDKKDPNDKYSESNCVLVCYPCNNAKSEVFTDKEFEIIGAVIGRLKKKGINEMMKNKFIQGLINDVKK